MPEDGRSGRDGGGVPGRDALADGLHAWAIHLLRWLREADRASPVSAAELSALSVLSTRAPSPSRASPSWSRSSPRP